MPIHRLNIQERLEQSVEEKNDQPIRGERVHDLLDKD